MSEEWVNYQKLVISDLTQLKDDQKEIRQSIGGIQISIAELQVKATAWGALGGIFSIAIALALQYLTKR